MIQSSTFRRRPSKVSEIFSDRQACFPAFVAIKHISGNVDGSQSPFLREPHVQCSRCHLTCALRSGLALLQSAKALGIWPSLNDSSKQDRDSFKPTLCRFALLYKLFAYRLGRSLLSTSKVSKDAAVYGRPGSLGVRHRRCFKKCSTSGNTCTADQEAY